MFTEARTCVKTPKLSLLSSKGEWLSGRDAYMRSGLARAGLYDAGGPQGSRKGSPDGKTKQHQRAEASADPDEEACDSELESISTSLNKSKPAAAAPAASAAAKTRSAAQPPNITSPRPHSESQGTPRAMAGAPAHAATNRVAPKRTQPQSQRPKPGAEAKKMVHHDEDELVRALENALEQQRHASRDLSFEHVDKLMHLLQLKKQRLLHTTRLNAPNKQHRNAAEDKPADIADGSTDPTPPSRTPDLDAEVSWLHSRAVASAAKDDDTTTVAATSRVPRANEDQDDSALHTPTPEPTKPADTDEPLPLQPNIIILGSGAAHATTEHVASTRLERLQRLHATAKAPTDHMFSSAYTKPRKPRLEQPMLCAQKRTTRKHKDETSYDIDRLNEIAERMREREWSARRESLRRANPVAGSSLSSPETVISSVSDYTAWSCPSPRSPNRVEFSHQPPPSLVPRIRLEALRNPRLYEKVQRSPDPNKAAALYSPCSAFTPRSSTDEAPQDIGRDSRSVSGKLAPHPEPDTGADFE